MAEDRFVADVRRLAAGTADEEQRKSAVRGLLRLAGDHGRSNVARLAAPDEPALEAVDLRSAVDAVLGRVQDAARQIEAERESAGPLLAELLALPEGQQALVATNHPRFRTWAFAERLQDECFAAGLEDPRRAVHLGRLSVRVAERVDVSPASDRLRSDLVAASWSWLGNALRLSGNLVESAAAFERAEALLREGTGDPLVEGKVLALHAQLRNEQSRFAEAAALARRAFNLFRRIGDRHQQGRALITLSNALGYEGRSDEALRLLQQAHELIDPDREPRVTCMVLHNTVALLLDAGRVHEAAALLPENRRAQERWGMSPLDSLRVNWLEARTAIGLGQSVEAEPVLRRVFARFLERGYLMEAATAALELAVCLGEQHRWGEVRELAAQLYPVFSSQEVEPEALAALTVFRDAALAETVEVAVVREVLGFLHRLDRDPTARFRPAGPST